MATFSYKARNKKGQAVDGELEATSTDGAAETLIGQGFFPIEIKSLQPSTGNSKSDTSLAAINLDWKKLFQSKHVDIQDLIMFTRQMFSLTKAGIPISRAIYGLVETTQSHLLKQALTDIHSDLNAGNNLATAFAKHSTIFSELYINLIHVGENSGRLEESFDQISRYLELEQETAQRIKSATRYPVIVITLIVAALFIINIFVIPRFTQMFNAFNAGELPLMTRVLISTSDFFVSYWWMIIGLILSGFYAAKEYYKTEAGQLFWDKNRLSIPLFGSIIYRSLLARFARSFSMMSRSGMPLISALNIISRVVNNAWVSKYIIDMRDGVEKGESISSVAKKSDLFSLLVIQMISVGEETGKLDDMLEEVADFYESQVDYDLKKIGDYIEPVLIVFVGAIVLVLALGVYMPMWDLASSTRNG